MSRSPRQTLELAYRPLARDPLASNEPYVGEAVNGEQAIAMTRQLLPDVVLLDVSMPGMDGVEATRRIHAECPGVNLIGLSMYDEAEQGQALRDAGAVAYLTKTSPFETLIAAIRTCIDRP